MGAGITVLRAWANAGNRVTPSNAKIDQGWLVGEQPACEYENERMYVRDQKVNQILTYLNAGVPIDDLLSGTATVTGSEITFLGGSSNESRIDESGFYVEDSTDAAKIVPEGMNFYNEDGTTTLYGRPVVVDLSALSWSDIGGGEYFSASAVGLVDLDYVSSIVVSGASVTGTVDSSGTKYIGTVSSFSISNGSPEQVLAGLTIRIGANPSTFDSLYMTMHQCRRTSSANV